jgi:diaminopimelate epimerase
MEFEKLQATGNDFILLNAIGKENDWSTIAREMCDRHFGVGADGLIIVSASSNADFAMNIFNADG